MKFYDKVLRVVARIPRGKVASYGQIAALIATPRAARAVGWCLHTMDTLPGIPWHRVINSKGFITTTCVDHTADLQKQLLEKEGIHVIRKNELWWIDISRYQWRP